MKIAIVGAGFCGLGLAHFLLQTGHHEVTLFDPRGIGGGASGVATGLLHPYPGEQGRRSWRATEAIAATVALLNEAQKEVCRPVAFFDGIVRIVKDEAQQKAFLEHSERYGDVVRQDEHSFLIRSGITVHCVNYLWALWRMVEKAGGSLISKEIGSLAELSAYDQIVLAAGGGMAGFAEAGSLRFHLTKGQVLAAEVPGDVPMVLQSQIGKGYVAKGESPHLCYLGSTYERPFASEGPDFETAKKKILPNLALFFPDVERLRFLECRAGVRVSRVGHYYPIIARFSPRAWGFTAMGSRGLIYHAYLAQFLAKAMDRADEACIPTEVLVHAIN